MALVKFAVLLHIDINHYIWCIMYNRFGYTIVILRHVFFFRNEFFVFFFWTVLNNDLKKLSEWTYECKMQFNIDLNKQAQGIIVN